MSVLYSCFAATAAVVVVYDVVFRLHSQRCRHRRQCGEFRNLHCICCFFPPVRMFRPSDDAHIRAAEVSSGESTRIAAAASKAKQRGIKENGQPKTQLTYRQPAVSSGLSGGCCQIDDGSILNETKQTGRNWQQFWRIHSTLSIN